MVKLQSICLAWIWVLSLNSFKYKARKLELKATYKWAMAAVAAPPRKAAPLLALEVASISVFKSLDTKIIHEFSLKTFILLVCQLWHLTLISELTNSVLHFSDHKLAICLWPDSTHGTMLSPGCCHSKWPTLPRSLACAWPHMTPLTLKKTNNFRKLFQKMMPSPNPRSPPLSTISTPTSEQPIDCCWGKNKDMWASVWM